jgi:hypothetical protein
MVGAFIPWYQGSELFRITMCGIAGYFNHCGLDGVDLGRMASAIAHRGPDGDGFYVKSDTGTGLAHRRLAILDLSEMGKQPMTYADSGCWISYNGELYNYIELRAELKTLGCSFSTNTDTEVLLASYCMWGIESFRRFNGMFSFAIYDEPRNKLLLCRDNFGIKPLYYWRSEQQVGRKSDKNVFDEQLHAGIHGVQPVQGGEQAPPWMLYRGRCPPTRREILVEDGRPSGAAPRRRFRSARPLRGNAGGCMPDKNAQRRTPGGFPERWIGFKQHCQRLEWNGFLSYAVHPQIREPLAG